MANQKYLKRDKLRLKLILVKFRSINHMLQTNVKAVRKSGI